jgi:hypothetical protein
MTNTAVDAFSMEGWARLSLAERRSALAAAMKEELRGRDEVTEIVIEIGPRSREYDLTVAIGTDVGRMRTALWTHARAMIFTDPSIHPANRAAFGPLPAIRDAADRLLRRLAVEYRLESRGLTMTLSPEPGVERTWTAEHSTFRRKTAVTREDRVDRAGDVDVRDLLAHFYTGPSLRLVSESGEPFLLPAATEAEGPLVALCHACHAWTEGSADACAACGSDKVDVVVVTRPTGR